jgi:hypothetical protein
MLGAIHAKPHSRRLKLALRELLGARNADLLLSGTGKVYAPQLAHKLAEIEALPEALTGGRPLAQELADTDDTHDGLGEAMYYQIEALLRLPFTEPEQKASLQRIREAFVPRLGVLRMLMPTKRRQRRRIDRRSRR